MQHDVAADHNSQTRHDGERSRVQHRCGRTRYAHSLFLLSDHPAVGNVTRRVCPSSLRSGRYQPTGIRRKTTRGDYSSLIISLQHNTRNEEGSLLLDTSIRRSTQRGGFVPPRHLRSPFDTTQHQRGGFVPSSLSLNPFDATHHNATPLLLVTSIWPMRRGGWPLRMGASYAHHSFFLLHFYLMYILQEMQRGGICPSLSLCFRHNEDGTSHVFFLLIVLSNCLESCLSSSLFVPFFQQRHALLVRSFLT
jgi:hypothetical protein